MHRDILRINDRKARNTYKSSSLCFRQTQIRCVIWPSKISTPDNQKRERERERSGESSQDANKRILEQLRFQTDELARHMQKRIGHLRSARAHAPLDSSLETLECKLQTAAPVHQRFSSSCDTLCEPQEKFEGLFHLCVPPSPDRCDV